MRTAMLALILVLFGCGGEEEFAPSVPHETVVTITGTVRSAADSTPIADASVTLRSEVPCFSNCTRDLVYDTSAVAFTGVTGAYTVRATFEHSEPECPFSGSIWKELVARVDGYGADLTTWDWAGIECVEAIQVHDFWLNPL